MCIQFITKEKLDKIESTEILNLKLILKNSLYQQIIKLYI